MMVASSQPLAPSTTSWLAADVRQHLGRTPRQLPARALYDDLGSALFDAICQLPWYPVTRAECRLLDAYGSHMLRAAGTPGRLVEMGCGNGAKLGRLLRAARIGPHTPGTRVRRVDLVDVSSAALATAVGALALPGELEVVPHHQSYQEGLLAVSANRREDEPLCVLFLGSNIGNFDPAEMRSLLDAMRTCLRPLDTLLVGVDLVKPRGALLAAYDDPLGVTAAFNKNLLVRLNRELSATFDLAAFDHRAVWNAQDARVEMHLVSRRRQRVEVPGADLSFDLCENESIWTESSYKFTAEGFEASLARAGFEPAQRWLDEEGQFLLVLGVAR